MKPIIYFILNLFFIGLTSCKTEVPESFLSLTNKAKAELKNELMDSLKSEMHAFIIEQNSIIDMAFPPVGPYYPILISKNDNKNISTRIVNHFTVNLNKDINKDKPPYHWLYEKNQIEEVKKQEKWLNEIDSTDYSDVFDRFLTNQIKEGKMVLNFFKLLKTKNFRKIYELTHVQLDYKKNSWVLNSALFAYFELRNTMSNRYFKQSYLEVFYENKKNNDSTGSLKIDALKWAFPVQILDIPYMKENDFRSYLNPTYLPIPIDSKTRHKKRETVEPFLF